jgi:nitrogen fixation protein NifU and related proteins
MFNNKIISIFENPKNVGIIKGSSAIGEAGSATSGELIKFYIKVENNILTEIKFKAYGGVLTIATCSVITCLVKDKSLEDVRRISCEEILKELECYDKEYNPTIELCIDALFSALSEYYKSQII